MSASISSENELMELEEGKFLSFFLGREEYGIEILKVQEIIGLTDVTPIPKMPDFIDGIINLRGKIVPVINLRKRFGLQAVETTEETVMIVVRQEEALRAIVVDRVSEVNDITKDQLDRMDTTGLSVESNFLKGLGKVDKSVKMIVNVEQVAFDIPALEKVQALKDDTVPEHV